MATEQTTQSQTTPTPPNPFAFPRFDSATLPTFNRTLRFLDAVTDTSTAAVGRTPRRIVWASNKARLYRYLPKTEQQHRVPLLMVHSLISRSYILDLIPGNSMVEFLVEQGFDVYLTDWGVPSDEDSHLRLEDYVLDYLPRMVAAVQRTSGVEEVSMFGYCMGGLLALLYAATHPDGPVRNLITLATPVDFDHLGLQGVWSRQVDAARLTATHGNVPAALIQQSFQMLKPASEVSPVRFIGLWQKVDDDRYVEQFRAFDRWSRDHVPFPGACFEQTVRDFIVANKLVNGGMTLAGQPVDLATITVPFLAIAAEADHIVPLASTNMQTDLVGSDDKQFLTLPGGHVGLAAGRGARSVLWPKLTAWLAQRSA
jgi:polyhydroxyalkanoate synthase